MRVLRYARMPDAKAEKAAAPAKKQATRTDEEYLTQLAKEFESIPDRGVPPAESQNEDQFTAMNRMSAIPSSRCVGAVGG